MEPRVVIIGHSYLSRLSLIRSVAQIGCDITVIMTGPGDNNRFRKPIDYYSKYVTHSYYCSRKDIPGIIALLKNKCADPVCKTVIIPDGDDIVVAIDDHKDELKENFYFPHIIKDPSSVAYWMEKTHQKELAEKVGLNVAGGTVIDIVDGRYSIPDSIKYPCYSKPLATMNGGKGGMRKCKNPEELAAALDYVIQYRNRTVKVLVEDYKEIETEYALLGLSDGEQVIIPAILEFLIVSKQNKGIALKGKVIPIDPFEDLVNRFKQFVLEMGFVGVFDIDFYKSDGKLYFCEMNLRFGGSGYAVTKMGVNLPALMVSCFYGESMKGVPQTIRDTSFYVNEKMCMDDWNGGFISRREFKRFISQPCSRFIPDEIDTRPERKFRVKIIQRSLINRIKSLMRF